MTPFQVLGLTPHLFVPDANATSFDTRFGATELFRNRLPDGRVLFVEIALGQARLLLSDETPSLGGAFAPATIVFRAVPVPEGTHTVELRYASETLQVGLLVSVCAVGLLLGLIVGAVRRR